MQVLTNNKIVRTDNPKPDERFIKSLKLNKRTQDSVRALLANGFLEVHIRAIIDSYRNGTAMQSYFTVLQLHWAKPQISTKNKAK